MRREKNTYGLIFLKNSSVAQQSVHRTAGGLRVLSLIQSRNLVPFGKLVLPAAGNAGRWAAQLDGNDMNALSSEKYIVYNLRSFFSRPPGDIAICPDCEHSIVSADLKPSKRVSEDLSDRSARAVHFCSRLYSCMSCRWWAVRESWSLYVLGVDYDFLIVGQTNDPGMAIEDPNQQDPPWLKVLENEHIYEKVTPLPNILATLFTGKK
jgi:hypothetical protein